MGDVTKLDTQHVMADENAIYCGYTKTRRERRRKEGKIACARYKNTVCAKNTD